MSRVHKRLVVRLTLAAVLFAVGCSPVVSINVTGGWVGDMTWTSGRAAGTTSPISFDLVQTGNDISGTIELIGRGTLTYTITITFGRVTGSRVEFLASGTNDQVTPPVDVSLDFDGEATTTEMSGTGTATLGGTPYTFTWTATLVTPPVEE